MDYVLALACLAFIPALAVLARSTSGALRGQAMHPFNIVGVLIGIIVLDFLTLIIDIRAGDASSVLGYVIGHISQVRGALIYFALSCLAIYVGVALALGSFRRTAAASPPSQLVLERRSSSLVMAIYAALTVGLAVALIIMSLSEGSVLYIAGTRTIFFREYPIFAILSAVGLPAFFLYGARHGLSKGTLGYAVLMIVCFIPVGSRGLILSVMVGLGFWLAMRYRLPLAFVYLAIPPAAVFTGVYRYLAREAGHFGSLDQLLDYYGGYFGLLFRTPDIALAEGLTVGVMNETISRGPFDSLLGLLTAPIPRSVLPWKPYGASTDFTRTTTPEHWDFFGSETTITGFVNLYLEQGYFVALVVLTALTFLWARLWLRSLRDGWRAGFAGPALIIISYTFVRADLYNVALFLWPLAVVLLTHVAIKAMLSPPPAQPMAGPSRFPDELIVQGRS